ncbi:hypothetical protein F3Y22_tig00112738pilonHSYRG00078 [Hibiscus syriacus]|uniref:Retrovirus-related Pol polyprotein from transposon TNT 1-94-like beta-barrel domain-containing protein n=1 Tax=Hibiscus syriacus TaxID=106335 RepID=A0A6A2WUL6_HIBSY|nr:hypothetical protein F3Y22_tig00112738pilonHSYRG00078 [Hibiscus syriacus]
MLARDPESFATYKVSVDGEGRLGRITAASGMNHTIMFARRDHARLDVKIEDEDKAMIMLCSLPLSYEHMVTTLTYEKETIKVEEITAALLAHNQRKQNVGESSQADSLYVKGNRDRGRKPEKAGYGKWNFRSKARDKKTINYYKCKEERHMKRDCPKLKKQTDEKRDDSSKYVSVVKDDNSDCSEGDMLSISMNQLTDSWILDFGCSYHIIPNREWFSTYRSVNSGSVYLGDDRCCNIVDLKKNLISLETLHKNGFIHKADEDMKTIQIVKGALIVMKGKMTAGNIYRFLGSTVIGEVHSVKSCDNTTKLWHIRLAHLSERGLPKHFWVEAVNMACYLINRSPRASLARKVVEEDPVVKKIVINRDVVFYERFMLQQKKDMTVDYNLARDKVRRPNIKPPNRLCFKDLVSFALTVSSDDPITFHNAVTSQENDKWMTAIVEEMESLNHNHTWELVRLLEGDVKKILGMEIYRDRDSRKPWLSQRGYVEKMLERFAMSSAKPVSTSLANHFKLSSEQFPKTYKETKDITKIPYSNVVGCFMYAMRDNTLVVGYVDSDYTGDLDNRRSTTGYVFTLGGGPICWKPTIQSVVALSTTEAEYMEAAEAAKEALWLTSLVKELGVQQGGVQLLCDYQRTIHLAKNQGHDIRQGGDLLGITHKYTDKDLQRKSRSGGYDYVGWGTGDAPRAPPRAPRT